jgi:hypothetical protein
MANFTADDLINNDYSPTVDGGDNPKYIGVLDRIKVDKSEEYEVVYFCNSFLEKYNVPKTKESFQKVERLLRHADLKNLDNRQNLITWIANNWNLK